MSVTPLLSAVTWSEMYHDPRLPSGKSPLGTSEHVGSGPADDVDEEENGGGSCDVDDLLSGPAVGVDDWGSSDVGLGSGGTSVLLTVNGPGPGPGSVSVETAGSGGIGRLEVEVGTTMLP